MKGLIRILLFMLFLLPVVFVYPQALISKIDSVNSINYEFIVSNTRKSIEIFSENLKEAQSIGYEKGEAGALGNLGLANYIRGNYDKSTQSYLAAIDLYEKIKDYKSLSEMYGEYGYQLKRREMNKAVNYMRKAISLAESKNIDELTKSKLYDNYGVLKEMQEDADSAMYFYTKALRTKEAERDSLAIPYSLNKIAGLKILGKNFQDAMKYLNRSDEFRKMEKGDYGKAENLSLYGDLFDARGDLDSAIVYYEDCLSVSLKLGYKFLIQYSYQHLTELYKKKKEFSKALSNFQKYITYKDSVTNLETNSAIAQLEIDYETAQKDKIIAANQHSIAQKNLQFSLALVSLALLVVASGWIYKYQKQKSVKEKNEIEFRNRLARAELENKLSGEKLRLSRELHDNIGSQLTFIISSLDNVVFADKNNNAAPKLNRISSFGRETLNDLRNTIWAIKQEDGDISKLHLKINELISKVGSEMTGISIGLIKNTVLEYKLSSAQMLNIFRIVQEAIQNSLKHSGATVIEIAFEDIPGGFKMKIQDNGKGFDPGKNGNGNGLQNMKQRCEESSGRFSLKSGEDGTTIECAFEFN